jgi:cyclopropane fatty-acyl-phospholipid synthase-like methyltransferase
MPKVSQTARSFLSLDQFPRASTYDPAWVLEHQMGPNVLWLTEFLCEKMALRPGMRVLDLGCGKALSSIFLAREFDVQVWATDLWIGATENAVRIREAALDDRVFPLHCDARDLPFADGFFDAIISVDAFEYFGTEANFLGSLIRTLKMGGEIGVANAGVIREVDLMPDDWPDDFSSFHSPEWWRQLWSISRLVEVTAAENHPNGRELWLRWNRAVGEKDDGYLTSKAGENLTFHRLVGRRIK